MLRFLIQSGTRLERKIEKQDRGQRMGGCWDSESGAEAPSLAKIEGAGFSSDDCQSPDGRIGQADLFR